MKLTEILSFLPFYKVNDNIDTMMINAIQMDHRKIQQGDLFICIPGFTVDGHDFAERAIANGASAVIAEKQLNVSVPVITVSNTTRAMAMIAAKYFDFPTQKMSLIGITGTNGKTTITYLLEAILKRHKRKTGLIGTIQMKIGEEAFTVKNTTPDSLFLQNVFNQMVDKQVDNAIMEVSSHALDLGRVFGCDFDVAIFTNLSQDHLDYHTNMDDYLRAKSLLFAQLGNAYGNGEKFAILNEDDSNSGLIKRSTAQPVITYGLKNKADVMAVNINLDITHTKFELKTPIGYISIQSQLIGMFNVYNMLAASSAAIALDVPLTVIKDALENIKGVSGRFEQVAPNQQFATIVDYAHTPDSLENVLETIKEFAKQKVYVVVGCGGDRDRTKRPLMAAVALKYADWTIFTSDNPRTEDPTSILNDMTDGLESSHFEVIEDRKKAIYRAVNMAKEGDIILIAGKGHETYQEINKIKYDFDDRRIAGEAIQSKEI